MYWTSGPTTRPTPSTRHALPAAARPAAHALPRPGEGPAWAPAAASWRCGSLLHHDRCVLTCRPPPSPTQQPAPTTQPNNEQMPKTYSFLVKYSFLWRATFTLSQVRAGMRAAADSRAEPISQRHKLRSCCLVSRNRLPNPPAASSAASWGHAASRVAAVRLICPPGGSPSHARTNAHSRMPPRVCPQPRLMHVPCSTATAAVVGHRVSEAFDLYQPDLVVSVHPLMQVGKKLLGLSCFSCTGRRMSTRSGVLCPSCPGRQRRPRSARAVRVAASACLLALALWPCCSVAPSTHLCPAPPRSMCRCASCACASRPACSRPPTLPPWSPTSPPATTPGSTRAWTGGRGRTGTAPGQRTGVALALPWRASPCLSPAACKRVACTGGSCPGCCAGLLPPPLSLSHPPTKHTHSCLDCHFSLGAPNHVVPRWWAARRRPVASAPRGRPPCIAQLSAPAPPAPAGATSPQRPA